MKKLMIAAVIAVAGVAAEAASIMWTTTALADLPSSITCNTGKDLGKGKDVMMYIWEYSASDWAKLDGRYTSVENIWNDFKSGDLQAADAVAKQSSLTAANPKTKGSDSWAVDDSVYAAILYLHDDTQAFTADSSSAYMANYANGTATAAGSAVTNLGNKIGGSGSATKWESVPEPTSGLLLLLGVAGLALRRRRA